MRGYDPRSVDEFMDQLERDDGVQVPDFQRAMRGYDPRYVDERIQQIKEQGA
jgi:cell division septum initiation protein DivIVA